MAGKLEAILRIFWIDALGHTAGEEIQSQLSATNCYHTPKLAYIYITHITINQCKCKTLLHIFKAVIWQNMVPGQYAYGYIMSRQISVLPNLFHSGQDIWWLCNVVTRPILFSRKLSDDACKNVAPSESVQTYFVSRATLSNTRQPF